MNTLQFLADLWPFTFFAFLLVSDTGLTNFGLCDLEVLLG